MRRDIPTKRTRKQIEKRLATLAKPEGDLLDIFKVLQKVTGSDAWVEGDEPAKITVSEGGKILGKINALRDITQAMFYSSASNMSPEFLPDVTVDQLYRLLEWTYWYQALTEMDNSQAITVAAPLAASILEALREDEGGDEADVLNVFIFVGHDTDISRIASLFGLRFDLDPPYYTSPRAAGLYAPAPPGSAMHFVHDIKDQRVEMAFVYPVLIAANGHLYWDGRVTTTSMKKRNSPTDALEKDGKNKFRRRRLSVIGSDKDDNGIKLLEDRISSNLLKYEGALECFKRANELPSWPRVTPSGRSAGVRVIEPGITTRSGDSAEYLRILYSIGIICASVVIIWLLKKKVFTTAAERANTAKSRHRRILSGDGSVDGVWVNRRRMLSGESAEYDELELKPIHSD